MVDQSLNAKRVIKKGRGVMEMGMRVLFTNPFRPGDAALTSGSMILLKITFE